MSHLGHKSFALGIRSSNNPLQEKTEPALDSSVLTACANLEGGRGSEHPPPPEKSKINRVFSNTCPDPLEITKLPSQNSMLGHFAGGPIMAFRWPADHGPLILAFGISLSS